MESISAGKCSALIIIILAQASFVRTSALASPEEALFSCEAHASCLSTQAIAYVNQKYQTQLHPGSIAMLHVAISHSKKMANTNALSSLPVSTLNTRDNLCGTFFAGAFVAKGSFGLSSKPMDAASVCVQLLGNGGPLKKNASVRFRKHLKTVFGIHVDESRTVWCTVLYGSRTKLKESGNCSEVHWPYRIGNAAGNQPKSLREKINDRFRAIWIPQGI